MKNPSMFLDHLSILEKHYLRNFEIHNKLNNWGFKKKTKHLVKHHKKQHQWKKRTTPTNSIIRCTKLMIGKKT